MKNYSMIAAPVLFLAINPAFGQGSAVLTAVGN
jgi:hypothetical protein